MHYKKIERMRNKAGEKNFFRYYTYRQRTTYYSTSLDQKGLVQAVLNSKSKRERNLLDTEMAETEYQETMERKREGIKERKRKLSLSRHFILDN
jgi:hypothetical protein